jgi:chromate reductase, NAD(P)H dehydrogenase (quinone)
VKVLAVSGSLRADSFNTSLLRAAAEAATDGVEVELFDPSGIGALPVYDQDLDSGDVPASVERLRAAWASADAILFATPEYNGSIPGGLKNAIDWASRPRQEAALMNKTVAVIGASTGQFGAMWAQADLRKVLGTAGARVVGDELPVTRAHEKFDSSGRLLDGELFERLRLLLETLAVEAIPAPVAVEERGPLRGPDPVTSSYW